MSVLVKELYLQHEAAAAEPLLAALMGTPVSHTSKDNENGCVIRFEDADEKEICTLSIGKNTSLKLSIGDEVCETGSAVSPNDVYLGLNAFLKEHAGKDIFDAASSISRRLLNTHKDPGDLEARMKARIEAQKCVL